APVWLTAWLVFGSIAPNAGRAAQPAVNVFPERVELVGNFSRAQLVVARPNADGTSTERSDDLTTQATYASLDPSIVTVSPAGQLLAVANGEAKITVAVNDTGVEVPVTVRGVAEQPQVGFS